jgi:hypothetical protein
MIVAAFIGWLKVAVTGELTATPVAPESGVTLVTVGAGADAVVNDHV